MAVIVVHNSLAYGGTGGNPATVSLHRDGPKVAVHELGHSLFGLGDEYDSFSARPEHDPNCDYQGCPKWSDLIGKWGVRCAPRKCDGGQFYASGETGMDLLGLPFGAANERITCCKYLYHTGLSPGYCSKFSTQGLNLESWCDKNLWKGRYGNIGMQLSALERNSNESASIDYLKFVADDPQGLQYVYVEHPAEWIVERQPNASWTCLQSSLDLNSGLYEKSAYFGVPRESDNETSEVPQPISQPGDRIAIEVVREGNNVGKQVFLDTDYVLEVPPDASGRIKGEDKLVERFSLKSIILNKGETCRVTS